MNHVSIGSVLCSATMEADGTEEKVDVVLNFEIVLPVRCFHFSIFKRNLGRELLLDLEFRMAAIFVDCCLLIMTKLTIISLE